MRSAWARGRNFDPDLLTFAVANPGFIIGESLIGVDPLGGAGADTPLDAEFTGLSISSPTTVESGLFVHREVETCQLSATLPEKVDLENQWIVVKYAGTEIYRGRVTAPTWTESVEVDAAYKPGNTATKTYRVTLTATNGEDALAGMATPPRDLSTATLAQRITSWTGLAVTTQNPAVDLPVNWQNAGWDTATIRRIYRATDSLGSLLDTLRAECRTRNMTFIYQPLAAQPFVLKPNNQWLVGDDVTEALVFSESAAHVRFQAVDPADVFVHLGRYVGYTSRTVGSDPAVNVNSATLKWGQYDIESPPVDGNPVDTSSLTYRASGANGRDQVIDLGTLDIASPGSNPYWFSRAVIANLPLRATSRSFTREVVTPLQSIQQLQGTVPGLALIEHDGIVERVAVLGRQHDVTPNKWMVRYTLGPPHLLDRTSDFDPGTPEAHAAISTGPISAIFEWIVPAYPSDVTMYEVKCIASPSSVLLTSDNVTFNPIDAPVAPPPGTLRTVPTVGINGDSYWILYTSNPTPGTTNPSPLWREGQPAFLGTL